MKKLIILVCFCTTLVAKAQQEPQYTLNQFNSQLEINPAYAGANDGTSVSLRYRKQWAGFEGAPSTLGFNAESKILQKRFAAGLTVISDRIGITQSTSVDLSLASHLRVSENGFLSVGIKLGVNLMRSDFSMLVHVDPTDLLYATINVTMPYAGFGALYYTDRLYVGFSIPRIVSFGDVAPQSAITKPHYYLYGGYRITLNEDIELRPALLGKYVSAAPFEVDVAMDCWYRNQFGMGLSYRTMDAVSLTLKWQMKMIYLGYSYDMTTSRLRTFNAGSHEIYLGITLGKKNVPDRTETIRY